MDLSMAMADLSIATGLMALLSLIVSGLHCACSRQGEQTDCEMEFVSTSPRRLTSE